MYKTFRNILGILTQKERNSFFSFVILNVLISILDIISLALLVILISFYTTGVQNVWLGRLTTIFYNGSIIPMLLFVVLFTLKSIAGYFVFNAQYQYVYMVASRISSDSLLGYLQGGYADYVNIDSSVHIRKILHQPIEFSHYVLSGMQQVIAESILSAFTIAAILIFNVKLFLLLAVVLIPPVIIISGFTKNKLKNARANVKNTTEKVQQYLQEALSGYIESSIYDKKSFFAGRYEQYQKEFSRFLSDVHTTQGIPSRLIEVFAVLGLFVLILINKMTGNSPALEIINIGAFMAAAYKIIPGIVRIANVSGQIKTYGYTVMDLVKSKHTGDKPKHYMETKINSVEFRDVSFRYKNDFVLSDFNLNISRGDFIGIHGASGSGKTTLVHLLLGFLFQDSGAILINDLAVNAVARQQFFPDISYTPQRPFLIHDTITANIILSDDIGDAQKLQNIINIVGLNELINLSADELDHLVRENGKNISGGQRQRIALARALYKDADLIILDESLSELDGYSQKLILEHLKKLAVSGRMILMVTHNEENLLYCNKSYLIG